MNGEWEICSVFLLLSSALVDTRSLVNYTLCHSFLYSFPLKIYFNKGTIHLFLKKIQVNVLDIICYLYFITFQFDNEMFLVNQLFIGCSVSFHCSEKSQEGEQPGAQCYCNVVGHEHRFTSFSSPFFLFSFGNTEDQSTV